MNVKKTYTTTATPVQPIELEWAEPGVKMGQ
jgi:hypothetical protein